MADRNDLIERLIHYRPTTEWGDRVHNTICDEAADEIKRLRKALAIIEGKAIKAKSRDYTIAVSACQEIADIARIHLK